MSYPICIRCGQGPDNHPSMACAAFEAMKTCGNCAHWGVGFTPNDREEADGIYRPCGAVVHDESYRAKPMYDVPLSTENDNWTDTEEDESSGYKKKVEVEIAALRKHLAVVQDGSGFYAALKVREDFGCVLWKKKRKI